MIHGGAGLHQDGDEQSAWTPWLDVSANAGDKTSVFFNRGLVISQFMSRYLEKLRLANHLSSLKKP
jgi:hypothetical protein